MGVLITRTSVASAASPLFEDNFASYSIGSAPTSGAGNDYFRWNGANVSGGGNQVQVIDAGGGNQAVRFRWVAGLAWSELRFRLPTRQTELWMKQTWTIPANYVHHAGHANDEGGLNNKGHIALWSAHENSGVWVGTEDYGASQRGPGFDINFWPNSPEDNYSRATMYMWGGNGAMDTHGPGNAKIAGSYQYAPYLVAADLGQTIDIYTQLKYASSADNDGVVRTWKVRGGSTIQMLNITNALSYVSGQLGFNYGYIMGYANARYTVTTDFLLHYIAIATSDIWGISS